MPEIRVGIGFDVHRLGQGRPLMMGGVEVPSPTGTIGHSDGDPLLHACADAVLGAAGLGDIGEHFPDTDPAGAGADSARILAACAEKARAAGWMVVNCDAIVFLERPRLGALKPRMAAVLSRLLGGAPASVKAKSAEGLGPVGAGEAAAAQAVVLLERRA